MTRLALVLAMAFAATTAVAQTPPPPPPPPPAPPPVAADPRVQTIPYSPGAVTRLKVAANFQLTVIFPGEQVENVAIGDSDGWQATLNGQGDAVFLKPLRQGGTTNMTVITNARVYSFELSAAFAAADDTPYVVRFSHADATKADSAAARPGVGRYRLSGAGGIRPVSIDDDGQRTYIVWAPNQILPAVFAIDPRGGQILLEGRMREGRFVIDAVHPKLLFVVEKQTARATRLRPRQ